MLGNWLCVITDCHPAGAVPEVPDSNVSLFSALLLPPPELDELLELEELLELDELLEFDEDELLVLDELLELVVPPDELNFSSVA